MTDAERVEIGRWVLNELVRLLPPPDSVFPIEDRASWLRAVAAVLSLTHGSGSAIDIEIENGEIVIKPRKSPILDAPSITRT